MSSSSQTLPLRRDFPFLDLRPQFDSIRVELREALLAVLESQHFILGEQVASFEKELAAYVGANFAVGCASGSDALLLALMALEIGPDDEVITTPFTFVATAGAIARLNARPVFVDIDPETYNLDPAKLASAITPKTRAIIPVHLFGAAADMAPIMAIAQAHRLPVIEDAAQAIGATYGGERVGTLGTIACFSFFPSKNLGGAGDGGMLTTNNAELADRLRVLRAHGSRRKYHYEVLGINSRLDAIQAALLRVKLQHLDAWAAARRGNAARYRALMQEFGVQPWISAPREPAGQEHVFNQFVVRADRRDRLQEYLTSAAVPTEIYYPSPLHLQPAFEYLGYGPGAFPAAEQASQDVLALPIYPELQEWQQRAVIETIAEFYQSSKVQHE